MELLNQFEVPLPLERTWAVLTDVERMAPLVPGCGLDEVDGDELRGTAAIKVGPITTAYSGTVTVRERDERHHQMVLVIVGDEQDGPGHSDAVLTARMHAAPAGTLVSLHTELELTGRIAQFGRGVLSDVAARLVDEFSVALGQLVAGEVRTLAVDDLTVDDAPAPKRERRRDRRRRRADEEAAALAAEVEREELGAPIHNVLPPPPPPAPRRRVLRAEPLPEGAPTAEDEVLGLAPAAPPAKLLRPLVLKPAPPLIGDRELVPDRDEHAWAEWDDDTSPRTEEPVALAPAALPAELPEPEVWQPVEPLVGDRELVADADELVWRGWTEETAAPSEPEPETEPAHEPAPIIPAPPVTPIIPEPPVSPVVPEPPPPPPVIPDPPVPPVVPEPPEPEPEPGPDTFEEPVPAPPPPPPPAAFDEPPAPPPAAGRVVFAEPDLGDEPPPVPRPIRPRPIERRHPAPPVPPPQPRPGRTRAFQRTPEPVAEPEAPTPSPWAAAAAPTPIAPPEPEPVAETPEPVSEEPVAEPATSIWAASAAPTPVSKPLSEPEPEPEPEPGERVPAFPRAAEPEPGPEPVLPPVTPRPASQPAPAGGVAADEEPTLAQKAAPIAVVLVLLWILRRLFGGRDE